MSLRDLLSFPALIMFVLGVLLSGTVLSFVHSTRTKVGA